MVGGSGGGGQTEANSSPAREITSPGFAPTPSSGAGGLPEDKGKAARTKIKRFMKDLVLSPSATAAAATATNSSSLSASVLAMTSCAQVLYHRSARNHVLLVFPREILVIDLDIGQTVGVIAVDRGAPQILDVYPARLRDAVFMLNEFGAVSLRARARTGAGLYVKRSLPTSGDWYS